jgi:hypothetical protein
VDAVVEVAGLAAGGGVVAALAGEVEGAGVVTGGGLLGESAALVAGVVPCPAAVDVEAVEVVAGLTAEVAVELTAEVADVTVELAADVAEEVADVTAEVSVVVTGEAACSEAVLEGAVAACACRENISKTTRIPAASIAHCAARRATPRKADCGTGAPPQRETGADTTAHL